MALYTRLLGLLCLPRFVSACHTNATPVFCNAEASLSNLCCTEVLLTITNVAISFASACLSACHVHADCLACQSVYLSACHVHAGSLAYPSLLLTSKAFIFSALLGPKIVTARVLPAWADSMKHAVSCAESPCVSVCLSICVCVWCVCTNLPVAPKAGGDLGN